MDTTMLTAILERIKSAGLRSYRHLGIEISPVSHAERIISAAGGMASIYFLILFERGMLGASSAAMLVASMGASSVLLFAVPHGALSQPWALLVGHTVSALIGVTCAKFVPDETMAAALAVGLAIGAMHYLRAVHPPGGATALTAVIGGPKIAALGYSFVLMPVLLNAFIMLAVAIVINFAFAWRRYPASLTRRPATAVAGSPDIASLTHADYSAALGRIGTFVDIDEDEFFRVKKLMEEIAESRHLRPEDIKLGHCYSNDTAGADWSVRQIVDQQPGAIDGAVIWRAVAGRERYQTGTCSRLEFAGWAKFEVARSENTWVRQISAP